MTSTAPRPRRGSMPSRDARRQRLRAAAIAAFLALAVASFVGARQLVEHMTRLQEQQAGGAAAQGTGAETADGGADAARRVRASLLVDGFTRRDGLVTNEYAFYNPGTWGIALDERWHVTSGSLFVRSGVASTGAPDSIAPDAASQRSTNSAIFRMESRERSFGDVAVALDLHVNRFVATPETPPVAWDGVHVPLRRQADGAVYYVTVNRRDGVVMIKKKAADDTYCALSPELPNAWPVPLGQWQRIRASVVTAGDGAVLLDAYVNGALLASGRDDGTRCGPALTAPGAVGLRMDNVDAWFDNYRVMAL